jgi:hypothetical protein
MTTGVVVAFEDGCFPKPSTFFDAQVGTAHSEAAVGGNRQSIVGYGDVRAFVSQAQDAAILVAGIGLLVGEMREDLRFFAGDVFESESVEGVVRAVGAAEHGRRDDGRDRW